MGYEGRKEEKEEGRKKEASIYEAPPMCQALPILSHFIMRMIGRDDAYMYHREGGVRGL